MNFVKKLRLFDYLIIFIILATFIVGFLTFNSKRATSANQIEATVPIELEIYLRGVATTDTDEKMRTNARINAVTFFILIAPFQTFSLL